MVFIHEHKQYHLALAEPDSSLHSKTRRFKTSGHTMISFSSSMLWQHGLSTFLLAAETTKSLPFLNGSVKWPTVLRKWQPRALVMTTHISGLQTWKWHRKRSTGTSWELVPEMETLLWTPSKGSLSWHSLLNFSQSGTGRCKRKEGRKRGIEFKTPSSVAEERDQQ